MVPFDPLFFLIAFLIGILFNYLNAPKPKIITKYPTPTNAGTIVYTDEAGVCYTYDVKESICPTDPLKIKKMPFQQSTK